MSKLLTASQLNQLPGNLFFFFFCLRRTLCSSSLKKSHVCFTCRLPTCQFQSQHFYPNVHCPFRRHVQTISAWPPWLQRQHTQHAILTMFSTPFLSSVVTLIKNQTRRFSPHLRICLQKCLCLLLMMCILFLEDKYTYDTPEEAGQAFGRKLLDRLNEMKMIDGKSSWTLCLVFVVVVFLFFWLSKVILPIIACAMECGCLCCM